METTNILERTQQFVLDILAMTKDLPEMDVARILGNEILKSAVSIEANYRHVYSNDTQTESVDKLSCCEKHIIETSHWIMMLVNSNLIDRTLAHKLLSQANELDALFMENLNISKKNIA